MVRILRIKDLEERRRMLLERSGAYREMLRVDVAGIGLSLADFKERFRPMRSLWRVITVAAPVVGVLLGRRRKTAESRGSFLPQLLAGLTVAGELVGVIKKFQSSRQAAPHDGHVAAEDTTSR
jgi:hypothetical protein